MRDLAVEYLRKAIKKHRTDKINATQRNASTEQVQAIEDKLNAAIWLLLQIGGEVEGQT